MGSVSEVLVHGGLTGSTVSGPAVRQNITERACRAKLVPQSSRKEWGEIYPSRPRLSYTMMPSNCESQWINLPMRSEPS